MATTPNTARQDVEVATKGGGGIDVPPDVYVVEFADFVPPEELPDETQQFGTAVRLVYEIVEGDYAGEKLDELASLKGGPRAKLRQRGEALRGQPYGDEPIRLVPLFGKRCKLVIANDENGFPKIQSALPIAAPRAAAAGIGGGVGVPPPRAATAQAPANGAAGQPPRRKF